MKLEEQVRWSLLNYPTIFKRRIDVLHHLYCVIGNGYDWVDGEQVDPDREEGEERVPVDQPIPADKPDFYQEIIRNLNAKRREEWEYNRANLFALCASGDMSMEYVYPICEYSKLMTVPDDVKPDWLDGAREMIEAVFRHEPSGREHDTAEDHARNLEWCDKALADIQSRFGREHGEPTCHREWKALHELKALKEDGLEYDFNHGRPGSDLGSMSCWRATLYGRHEMMFVYACDETFDSYVVVRRHNEQGRGHVEFRTDLEGMIESAREFAGHRPAATLPRP